MVAGAGGRARWYVDAGPFVFRGAVDRLLLGGGRRWPVPDGPVLRTGDRAGFWEVVEAAPGRPDAHDDFSLVLDAAVRAPGRVTMRTRVGAEGTGSRVDQSVTFLPGGVLGAAYLLTDLPARETLLELVHRRVLADLVRG